MKLIVSAENLAGGDFEENFKVLMAVAMDLMADGFSISVTDASEIEIRAMKLARVQSSSDARDQSDPEPAEGAPGPVHRNGETRPEKIRSILKAGVDRISEKMNG